MTIKTTERPRVKIDPERWHRLKDILAEALEYPSPIDRAALLKSRCANDAPLREEVESLVKEAEALRKDPTDSLEDCAEHATAFLWQDETPRNGWRIGAYVVTKELGRGGMGAVYLAERADGQFEKEVAIKVLKRGTDTDELLQRFAAERHILARLDHPNIAHLLDAGTTDDGLPYFVMEYVAGVPVTRFVRDRQLSIEERLAVFLKVCGAVEVAHRNHVVHRDLKPSNILVNADGEPKLLDFGIAKLLTSGKDSAQITAAGGERLTPICASPEQTDGRAITEASDVYALGALLYEMLTGEKPHKFTTTRPSREEIAEVIRQQEPLPPSVSASKPETARLLRGDLDTIILFALRKDPARRYASVADLTADIRRYLARQPVLARRPTFGYRARCLAKRQRPRLVAVATVVILTAGVLFALWIGSQQDARKVAGKPMAERDAPVSDFRKSIAVLPFESLGNNNAPLYFADGIQDNILTDLGKVGDLKVISRSGVAAYRGKNRNMKEIGRDLGVASVLEGSVQISGDRVRINAQLIDTRTDAQIWAEQYDRKVEDLFALESELAQTIAAQLKATLSTGEKAAIWKQPTQDLQAYDLYLRARASLNNARGPSPSLNWKEVVNLLNGAIARDSKFTLAYCLLNEAHVYLYRFSDDHSPQDLAAAKDAAETALRLEPNLQEARLALARYYYYGLSDYARTEEELSRIPSSEPHEVEFFTLASLVERRLGQWEASIRHGEKAVELDPQNAGLAVNLIQTYSGLRRYDDSERVAKAAFARLSGTAPERLWVVKSEAALAVGKIEEARAALDAVANGKSMDYQMARLWLTFLERNYNGAKSIAATVSEELKKMPDFWLTVAAIAHAEGNVERAGQANAEAKRVALDALVLRPNNPELLGQLAVAEAALGRKAEALQQARRAAEMLPPSADAITGPMCQARLVEVLASTGDRDSAFKTLGELVKQPFSPNYGDTLTAGRSNLVRT